MGSTRSRMSGRATVRRRLAAILGFALIATLLGAVPTMAAGSGTVNAQVTVARAAACLELSTSTVSFGTLALGAENQAGTPTIVATNCGDGDETLFASGTNAIGGDATWNLVDSAATCATTLGTDNYHLALATPGGGVLSTLSTSNKSLGTFAAATTATHEARIWTACPGSSGAGTTLGLQINYLVTNEEPPPPVVLEPIPLDQATADTISNLLFGGTRDVTVPTNCASSPSINCPGGAPAATSAQVHVVGSNVVATFAPGANRYDTSATLAVTTLQAIPVGIPIAGDCLLSVNTALGSTPALSVQVQLQWIDHGGTGQLNVVNVQNVGVNGLEAADISISGNLGCQVANLSLSFMLDLLAQSLADQLGGSICGDPNSDGFIPCPPLN
jgi:hypothetical protein